MHQAIVDEALGDAGWGRMTGRKECSLFFVREVRVGVGYGK